MAPLNTDSNKSLLFEQFIFEKLQEAEQEARTTEKRFSSEEVYSAMLECLKSKP